jgi:hypothetical protein
VITGEATNTGRRNSGAKIVAKTISTRITNGINTITGIEIGKVTGGIITVGEIIMGITILIHTVTTNIIITIIITGM